ncbi:hypothetical protein [Rhodococcus ruber]|uniref:hypothetical protein n=1 Tax=Rhodococcus ruber TaxID=1830 RepID=UPI00265F1A6F|nr:hypothetical protein [Rhodococcus ruber]MDO1482047.1 hypothetical protein [Rhodococcus ruber]
MPGLRLTPAQQSRVRERHARGDSLRSIARDLGVNAPGLSRWAKRAGLSWTRTPAAATEVVRRRLEAERLALAEQALADAIHLRERLWLPHEIVVNTPKGPQTVTLDLPDARAVLGYASAIEKLSKTHAVMSSGSSTTAEHAKSTLAKMHDVLTALARAADDSDSLEPPH